MKDIQEELKSIRNSPLQKLPTLEDLENIASECSKPPSNFNFQHSTSLSRMLPRCYTLFLLTHIPIKNLHEETLLFIFYMKHGSQLQIKAYNELINKGYLYSTQHRVFVILETPKAVTNTSENIIFFDPMIWERSSKEVVYDTEFIDSLQSHVSEPRRNYEKFTS